MEMYKQPSPKEKAVYQAVMAMFVEGADPSNITVAEITGRAGIGKGTAYEYFSDKEEMIAKALCYSVRDFCRQLYQMTLHEKGLYDKMKLILNQLEHYASEEGDGIFRVLNVMSDQSAVGLRFRSLQKEKTEDEMMPADLIRRVFLDEFREKAGEDEARLGYLVLSSISRLLGYGMALREGCETVESREYIKHMICRGITREAEELFSGHGR